MKKIFASIDLTKIDKTRIVKETFTNKDNQVVTKQVYKFEVVPLKAPQQIRKVDGTISKMEKTHFLAEGQTKEERDAKAPTNFIGDGLSFGDDDFTTF